MIWGSPYGALVKGYNELHPIHVRFQQRPTTSPAFRYAVQHVLAVSEDVVIAHIARLALTPNGEPLPPSSDPHQPFSEMAMYVLVRCQGEVVGCGTEHSYAARGCRSCAYIVKKAAKSDYLLWGVIGSLFRR